MSIKKMIRLLPDGHEKDGMAPTDFIDPANVIEGDPQEQGHNFFTNEDGNVNAGVWASGAFKESFNYPVDEMMVILSGAVTITYDDGSAETFKAGDVVIYPGGTSGVWESTADFKKFYMVYEPKAKV